VEAAPGTADRPGLTRSLRGVSGPFRLRGRTSGRGTNLALLALLGLALATGALGFAAGREWGRIVLIVHGTGAFALLVLAPWKSTIVRRGLRRCRGGRGLAIAFGVLIAACLASGILHSTGLARTMGPVTAMQVHVATALAAAPLAVWHVATRKVRMRRTDLGRRALVRSAGLVAVSTVAYGATEAVLRSTGAVGGARRFTGSYRTQSDDMPVTQWLTDRVPLVAVEDWSLVVRSPSGQRTLRYGDLLREHDSVRATLDCTGGWFAGQEWEGIRLERLMPDLAQGRSIEVASVTGYARRFPASDAGRLLLATRAGGRALEPGHGFPARLVAPGRRGFWWVKWVARIELSSTPSWWQPPFPLR
jgi:DMSO/TMAO reductase YedYZ molybdopterin-dependent catalytic subunit